MFHGTPCILKVCNDQLKKLFVSSFCLFFVVRFKLFLLSFEMFKPSQDCVASSKSPITLKLLKLTYSLVIPVERGLRPILSIVK